MSSLLILNFSSQFFLLEYLQANPSVPSLEWVVQKRTHFLLKLTSSFLIGVEMPNFHPTITQTFYYYHLLGSIFPHSVADIFFFFKSLITYSEWISEQMEGYRKCYHQVQKLSGADQEIILLPRILMLVHCEWSDLIRIHCSGIILARFGRWWGAVWYIIFPFVPQGRDRSSQNFLRI